MTNFLIRECDAILIEGVPYVLYRFESELTLIRVESDVVLLQPVEDSAKVITELYLTGAPNDDVIYIDLANLIYQIR